VVRLWILVVEKLGLYERFRGQEFYKIPASKRIWGRYVLQKFEIGTVFECFCPAKVRFAKGFLGKWIGQECPAKILLESFDSAGRGRKVGFVRMELGAGILQNSLVRDGLGAILSCKSSGNVLFGSILEII
jgi:hypothetical protein